MRHFVCLVALLLLFTSVVNADQYRSQSLFTSANGKFEARLKDGTWRLFETAPKKELYQFQDYYEHGISFHTMTLVVSDDGKVIVAVDDYSMQDFRNNPEVLFFFREGVITKRFKLRELADNRFLTVSVSHFRWVIGSGSNKFRITDGQLSLSTLDLHDLTFDSATGELKSRKRDLSDTAVFVFGKVAGLGGDRHKITVECTIAGSANKRRYDLFRFKGIPVGRIKL